MAGNEGTTATQIDHITEALGTMPREDIERLFLDFVRGFANASGLAKALGSEDLLRARVAAMTVREMAALLAPLVRIGERMAEERRATANRGARPWNPAHF